MISLEAGGAPVGLFADSSYEQGTVDLNPGDLILAYTDGVIEATNGEESEWGVEGLRKAATESDGLCANEIVDAIFASMDEFSLGRQTDDATVVGGAGKVSTDVLAVCNRTERAPSSWGRFHRGRKNMFGAMAKRPASWRAATLRGISRFLGEDPQ